MDASPVLLNGSGNAFDDALRREGWILFAGFAPWGMPIPFGQPAFRIDFSYGFYPSVNPRAVWFSERSETSEDGWGGTYSEFDGVSRSVIDRFDLPRGEQPVEFFESSVVVLRDDRTTWLWDRERDTRDRITLEELPALPGERRIMFSRGGELSTLDDRGARVAVERVDGNITQWQFSPDFRYAALDLDLDDRSAPIPSIADIVHGRVRYQPVPHRLAVIDCANGAATIVPTVYDNFPYPFVWSSDSRSLVFSTPFSPHGLWTYTIGDEELTWLSFGRRHAPAPLVDVSDLIPVREA